MKRLRDDNVMKQRAGFACVLVSTTMYGLMPSISQLGYEAGLNSYSILFGRAVIGLLLYLGMIFIKKESLSVTSEQKHYIMLGAACGIVNGILAYMSYYYLPAGIASLMAMMYIIFIVMLEILLRISELSVHKLIILGAAFLGILIIMWEPEDGGSLSVTGILLGLGGALAYSFQVLLFNVKPMQSLSMEVIFFYETLPVLIVMPIMAVWSGLEPVPLNAVQWGYSAALAVCNSLIAMLTFYKAVRLIGAGNASLVGTAEPFVSTLAGTLLLGDILTGRSIVGGCIIMASIFVLNYMENRKLQRGMTQEES